MIVDAHCHVWPDAIAAQVLAAKPSGLASMHDGTVDGLNRSMDASGVEHAMCLGVAAIARTVERTNEFIGSLDRTRFTPFGTIHPELPVEQNLRLLKDNGLRGVKLHPLFQDLSLTDPRVIDILHGLAEEQILVITHAGAGGDAAANARGNPAALRHMLDAVPGLTVIACHFGGYHRLDEAEKLIVGSRAYLETSWPPRVGDLEASRIVDVIRRHGADRVVFGSDWPMADPAAEIESLRAFGLEQHELDAILGNTLGGLLGLAA